MTDIKAMIAATGMTQKGFAEYLGIPKRTVESWITSSGKNGRSCPIYVLELIEYKLLNEGKIKESFLKQLIRPRLLILVEKVLEEVLDSNEIKII